MFSRPLAFARQVAKRGNEKTRSYQGIKLAIDRPQGFVQTGTDDEGNPWTRRFLFDYGYIPGTHGGDGEGLDIYLGPDPVAKEAHWVSQCKRDGTFDEYKVMLGFRSPEAAKTAYLAHTPSKYLSSMSSMPMDLMKALLGVHHDEWLVNKSAGSSISKGEAFAEYLRLAQEHDIAKWAGAREANPYYSIAKRVGEVARGLEIEGASPAAMLAKAHVAFIADALDTLPTLLPQELDVARLQKTLLRSLDAEADALAAQAPGEVPNLPEIDVRVVMKDDTMAADVPARAPEQGTPKKRRLDDLVQKRGPWGIEQQHYLTKEPGAPEKRHILGIVLEPDTVDAQGDTYSAEEIEKTAHFYMEHFRNVGLMHKGMINDRVKLLESYIAETDMHIAGSTIKAGTWLMKVRVEDDALWNDAKAGKFRGFSIGGFATKDPIA